MKMVKIQLQRETRLVRESEVIMWLFKLSDTAYVIDLV